MTRTGTSLQTLSWLGFFGLVAASWVAVWEMTRLAGLDLCGWLLSDGGGSLEAFAGLSAMWAIMMTAMMLPTLVPALATFDDLVRSGNATRAGWIGLVFGYTAVWAGLSVGFAALQVGFQSLGLVNGSGQMVSLWVSAALLGLAGAYQFTSAKAACRDACLSPMMFFLGRWRAGFAGGARMGAGLGLYCAGCCWAIMTLAFVGGTMNLAWMGLATLLMIFEKLPQIGQRVSAPAGAAMMTGGAALAGAATMGL